MCHVKNTGRCGELLILGITVILEYHPEANVTGRKTEYDLVGVHKGNVLINMGSQAPNRAAREWLEAMKGRASPEPGANPDDTIRTLDNVRGEVTHGDSRFDLASALGHMDGKSWISVFMEVEGVTLKDHDIATFPDVPTLRGIKHLHGLAQAVREGYDAYVLFAIQMKGIRGFRSNNITHSALREALREASFDGVHVLAYDCIITPNTTAVDQPALVFLG